MNLLRAQLICVTSVLLAWLPLPVLADWKQLAVGMELGQFKTSVNSKIGDSNITILRMDPDHWQLEVIGSSWDKSYQNQSAEAWAKQFDYSVTINAGMFAQDYSTHIGYLQTRNKTHNPHINHYQSVAAFAVKESSNAPPFQIFDLDQPGISMETILKDYTSVIQNLRLIKKPGENRWKQQDKIWSEAALGEDRTGRILLIYSRSPFSMFDLNEVLLSLNIDLVAAQHLEGGPEAQMFINLPTHRAAYLGSYETAFFESDNNITAWPIPNVIGIKPILNENLDKSISAPIKK